MKHIVFYSGGIGSYACAKRVLQHVPPQDVILLFTDTLSEDSDLYRFLKETSEFLCCELVHLREGRDLWQLFNDEGMIGNDRVDLCSRILKRETGRNWLHRYYPQSWKVTLYFGIDHSERHRTVAIARNWNPYKVQFPMCEEPFLSKCDMLKDCERDSIDPPRIYDEGFPHNNCNRFCVRAGHAHFLHLLKTAPSVFMENATKEDDFRKRTDKDVSVLVDKTGGTTKPLPMLEFKRQVESGERVVDPRDWGKGCQCMTEGDEDQSGTDELPDSPPGVPGEVHGAGGQVAESQGGQAVDVGGDGVGSAVVHPLVKPPPGDLFE